MHAVIITDDKVVRGPGGPSGNLASTRLRLIPALEALNAAGHRSVLLANTTTENIAASGYFRRADLVLFGKVFQDHSGIVDSARRAGKRVVVDVTDDFEAMPQLAPMRALVDRADGLVAASEGFRDLARGWVGDGCPIRVVSDPFDGPMSPPHTELGRSPLRLLWFGSPASSGDLNPHLGRLVALASHYPIELTLLSSMPEIFRAFVSNHHPARGNRFSARFNNWSVDAQRRALACCDLVILPGGTTADSLLKSANRLIAGIAAGRLCVATPRPSYEPFRPNALLVRDIAAGVDAAVHLPVARLAEALTTGQKRLRETYAPTVIRERWLEALTGLAAPAHEP